MKFKGVIDSIGWAALLLIAITFVFFISGCNNNDKDIYRLTILQTSDIHNHANGYGPMADYTPADTSDADTVTGGFARLAAKINEIRTTQVNRGIPVLLVDSGDFLMGTAFDLLTAPPITLQFFQEMGYDATTLGNHEFDWGPAGLYTVLGAAVSMGVDVPIIASNLQTSADSDDDDGLEVLIASGDIVRKRIVQKGGIKIGILGLMTQDSVSKAPAATPVTFDLSYDDIQQMVDSLRNDDKVDLVMVLSHGGINTDGTGDDADLAENVSGIDIIASGHYHTATFDPIITDNGTIIFEPGCYTNYLARLDIAWNSKTKEIQDVDFMLIPINDTIEGDPGIIDLVDKGINEINALFAANGLPALDTVMGTTGFDLEIADFAESSLGNLCADAIRYSANQLAAATGSDPYDIGVVASGVIRDNLYAGKTGAITMSDIYNVLPLGASPESDIPGYPLMSIYVNGQEIRNACEISASISHLLGSDYFLNFSGLRYTVNPAGDPGMMVVGVSVVDPSDTETTTAGTPINILDTTTLYHVVVDYYALLMMDFATSQGLPIVPKDAAGNPIPQEQYLDYRIDADPTTPASIEELKEWAALMTYFSYIGTAYGGQVPENIYGANGAGMGRITYLNP